MKVVSIALPSRLARPIVWWFPLFRSGPVDVGAVDADKTHGAPSVTELGVMKVWLTPVPSRLARPIEPSRLPVFPQ